MTTDLPKNPDLSLPKGYDPATVESQAYDVWLKERAFSADPNAPGKPYCIVIPPPNVTGALHLGHAINNTLQDILTRQHRMMGDNTLWIPGIDHAGIATQAVVEKQLKEQENLDRHKVGREGLVERIWKWKERYGDRIINQLKRLGCSCDWDRSRFTLDEMCARAVRETFFKLFKDGLIYRGKRLVNWDTHLQTSISDDEIYHETVKTSLWHIRYPIVDPNRDTGVSPVLSARNVEEATGSDLSRSTHGQDARVTGERPDHMVVATTRPETMLGDTAVAVHSEDPRWNWAIGKFVKLPLTDRLIPIIADDILVDPKFGTGVVKVTPAHDPNDYAVWQRHQGKPDQIDLINILTPDGRMNDNCGAYSGMKREAARKKVVEDLTHQGLLVKEEPYETQVGHSDRSKTPIEPYLSDQWFVKMAPLAEPALQVVRDGTIKFFPERHAQQYLSWLGEKRDWPISRQLWWGHRIPVWEARTPSPTFEAPLDGSQSMSAFVDESRLAITQLFTAVSLGNEIHIATDISGHDGASWLRICSRSEKVDQILALLHQHCKFKQTRHELAPEQETRRTAELDAAVVSLIEPAHHAAFKDAVNSVRECVQDPDVLDTWFSSALWPHSTLGWPSDTPELKKWYPTSVLLTGRDIITLWVARMVMTGMYNMGQKMSDEGRVMRETSSHSSLISRHSSGLGIPFHHVAINPTILDGKGERMSKSKGNGVDPVDIIETHGADALRFTLTHMATETQDVRLPVKKMANGKNTSDKFDVGRNFCNKLWNAARFVLASIQSLATENTEITEHTNSGTPSVSSVPSVAKPLSDRWILSRFNRTVAEANDALATYRFDQYARVCYDFFWRDFCDWYVEASKPAMKDPARAGSTAQVLAAVLDGALRLMHPMIPFITETIWWRLNDVRPQRGIPAQLECPPSPRLIKAAWPIAGAVAERVESDFARLQELIQTIRNLRNEHKVDVKKPVTVSILAPGDATTLIQENREMIELMATCQLKDVRADLPPVPNAARASVSGCEIFIEGLVDADAEKQRIGKRREELTKQIAALKGRLGNEGYISRAPAHLVQQTKDQLAEAEAELAKLG